MSNCALPAARRGPGPRLLRALPLLLLVHGCGDATGPGRSEVVVQAPSEVLAGDSVLLTARVHGGAGAGGAVAWSSSNPTVASVDPSGWLRARSAGSTTITATAGSVTGHADVTVRRPPVASLLVGPDGYTVGIDRTMRLTAVALDTRGDTVRDVPVTWSSSDTTVVKVLGEGVVIGVRAGAAVVSASAEGRTKGVVVLTGPAVGRMYLSPFWGITLAVGGTSGAELSLYEGGVGATPQVSGKRQVTWASSDPKVASVSPAGVVRGEAPGRATVTASVEGVSAALNVTVLGPVARVSISPNPVTLTGGSTATLSASAFDATGNALTGVTFRWSSSSPAVANVVGAASGGQATVTGLSRGSAQVVASAGGVTDTVRVTVIPEVATLQVTPDSATLAAGTARQFRVVARDVDGNPLPDRPVTWSSTNLGVAIVSATGVVTALGPGTTSIVASVEGRTGTARVTVLGAVSASGQWASISAGDGHTCAIDRAGRTYCWGRNQWGQLGNGSTDSVSVPVSVTSQLAFQQVSAVGSGTCAVDAAGSAHCWGYGGGYVGVTSRPQAVGGARRFRAVHAGGSYGQACGLETTGAMYCWAFWASSGWSEMEQPGSYRAVIASNPCGLTTTGVLRCWGQRGTPTVPTDPGTPTSTVGLSASTTRVCLWNDDGSGRCSTGRFSGIGGSFAFSGITVLPGGVRVAQLSAGGSQACGLTAEGQAWCWQFGVGGTAATIGSPEAVGGALRFTELSAGGDHACGITAQGAAYCWGANRWGQLGVGAMGGSSGEPARIRDP